MSDGVPSRQFLLRALDVDVDPLVVACGLGEPIDRAWVTSNQSLTPISLPTEDLKSSKSSNTRTSGNSSFSQWPSPMRSDVPS